MNPIENRQDAVSGTAMAYELFGCEIPLTARICHFV